MSLTYKKIILVTDGTAKSKSAEDTAAHIATASGAALRIIDTLNPPSMFSSWVDGGATGAFGKLVEYKMASLNHIADRFRELGLTVEVAVLEGNSSQQIAADAKSSDADLVIRYKKGSRSSHPGQFGKTAKKLMQACPCPILFVGENQVENPRLLACVTPEHELEENRAILLEASKIPAAGPPALLYCWKFFGGDIFQEYVGKEVMEQTEQKAADIHRGLYETMLEQLDRNLDDPTVHLETGDPVEVIPKVCETDGIDIVVMSSGSLNNPMFRFLGSTVEAVLETVPIALLIVKPTPFHVDQVVGEQATTGAPGAG